MEDMDSKNIPVKITLHNPVVVSDFLEKSRDLKNSADHISVYVKPDRATERWSNVENIMSY